MLKSCLCQQVTQIGQTHFPYAGLRTHGFFFAKTKKKKIRKFTTSYLSSVRTIKRFAIQNLDAHDLPAVLGSYNLSLSFCFQFFFSHLFLSTFHDSVTCSLFNKLTNFTLKTIRKSIHLVRLYEYIKYSVYFFSYCFYGVTI